MTLKQTLVRESFLPALRVFRKLVVDRPDVGALRRWAARLEALFAHDEPGVGTREIGLPYCGASWFEVDGAPGPQVILYLHGGAFIIETPRLHGAFLARLCRQVGARALMPHYRLAPEHIYPAAADDCLDAYRWLLAQGHAPHDIVIAGDSAGGGLCLGLLTRLRGEGLPLPACALVLSPLTDGSMSGDSITRNDGLDPMFTARSFHAMAPLYMPDAALRTSPQASPLHADLDGLPPILVLVGSSELLLDDAVRFAQKCPSATLEVWHAMPHVFPLFDFLPEAARAVDRAGRFLRDHLAAATAALHEHAARGDSTAHSLADAGTTPVAVIAEALPVPPPVQASLAVGSERAAPATSTTAWLWLALAVVSGVAALATLIGGSPHWLGPAGIASALLPGVQGATHLPNLLGTLAVVTFALVTPVGTISCRAGAGVVAATLALGPVCGLALILWLRQSFGRRE